VTQQPGASSAADSASAPSVSASRTSPTSGSNQSSGDFPARIQDAAPDSSQVSQARVDSTLSLSSAPQTVADSAQPAVPSGGEGLAAPSTSGPDAASATVARGASTQSVDSASVVAEVSSLMEQGSFAAATGTDLGLAAQPEQTTASGSRAAQGSTGSDFRQNQATTPHEGGASSRADSASAPSAPASRTSPTSGSNQSSGDAPVQIQDAAPDSSQESQARVDSTLSLSSAPPTLVVPSQPVTMSSGGTLARSTPNQDSVPNSAQGNVLDAWGDLAARAGRIVTSAALTGGTDQAEMRVDLRTEALGAMQLTAFLEGDRMGAVIDVHTPAAHSWLVTELPALHQAFASQNLHLDTVSIFARGGTDSSLDRNAGGRGGSGSPSYDPPRSNSAPVQSGAESANETESSPEVESWPVRGLPGRLSVRA